MRHSSPTPHKRRDKLTISSLLKARVIKISDASTTTNSQSEDCKRPLKKQPSRLGCNFLPYRIVKEQLNRAVFPARSPGSFHPGLSSRFRRVSCCSNYTYVITLNIVVAEARAVNPALCFLGSFFLDSFIASTKGDGDEGDRTPDPLLAKQVLSQLSYIPRSKATIFQRSSS